MCGIAGFIDLRGFDKTTAKNIGRAMGRTLAHRGPDNSGVWIDDKNRVVFAHQRLAIIDLSQSGHQPMLSASGRFVICYNGEIYNHKELRSEVESYGNAPCWRGHSDTETILACIDVFGLEQTLTKLIGMYAIALWDKETKSVFLARDRIGEKPLYYGRNGPLLLFGSELKALRAHPEFLPTIDRSALCLFLRYNYVPQPYSIYNGIKKLPPGHIVRLSEYDSPPQPYWSFYDELTNGRNNLLLGSDELILKGLEQTLQKAVRRQMRADVPLGAFLSGGVDSSLIVALMQEQSTKPVKSFSIGFDDKQFDEAPFAKRIAKHLGTEHHQLYVDSEQARNTIPNLSKLYDEPFSDSSQIPTFLVAQMARRHVTVSLSGDGGDELFGGYNRYTWGDTIWSKLNLMPQSMRRLFSSLISSVPPSKWDRVLGRLFAMAPQSYQHQNVGDKLHKIANIFQASSENNLYLRLVSQWNFPEQIVIGGVEPGTGINVNMDPPINMSFSERMMFWDAITYLPDDILVKVDRAAMGVSLETRLPFLDLSVVKFSCQLAFNMKIRNGVGKWCLRELLYRRVPKHLIDRPKMGFRPPIGDWLREPLRDWAENLLSHNRLTTAGYFNADIIRKKWTQHTSGEQNFEHLIWPVLMFESWREDVGL